MLSNGDEVLVHVSGGRELALKPGLNIIGGVQPRGLNEVMDDDMPDITLISPIPLLDSIADIEDMEVVAGIDISIVISMALGSIDIGGEVAEWFILMSELIDIAVIDEDIWFISVFPD